MSATQRSVRAPALNFIANAATRSKDSYFLHNALKSDEHVRASYYMRGEKTCHQGLVSALRLAEKSHAVMLITRSD
jgi:hypothetical protein